MAESGSMEDSLGDKVTPQSLVDIITVRLERAIATGDLEPGTRLSEQGLAASLGVSRGPLREAIRRLEGRKLLERVTNIGVRVKAWSLKELHDLSQIRERLEALACALAAENMSDGEIAGLEKILDREEARANATHESEYDMIEDFAFHQCIAAGSHNERLQQILSEDIYYLFQLYSDKLQGRRSRSAEILEEHRAIVAAIVERDASRAEYAMRVHLGNARLHVEKQMDEDGSAGRMNVRRSRIRSLG
ncbi:MAG: GntR family transcriptional regulator [Sphingobium sp.]